MDSNRNLKAILARAAQEIGQVVSPGRLDAIENLVDTNDPVRRFILAWQTAGLKGTPTPLTPTRAADLPFVAWHPRQGWLLVTSRRPDGRWIAIDGNKKNHDLVDFNDAVCLALPSFPMAAGAVETSALRLTRKALFARWKTLSEAIMATALVNFLTLATSLYAMQVYDRVIPNQSFQTLAALTVGVVLAIVLELLLKQLRARMMDRVATAVDHELSLRLFQRLLSIRMESRPPTVGTLASQVKGFEMVRGVLASASLMVMVDVPFALLFIAIIAAIAGYLALLPLFLLPIALAVGGVYQRLILRAAQETVSHGNRKAGLLVEAVDGAETIKAHSAEWLMEKRWKALIVHGTRADDKIRADTAMAQNLTVALQQLGYVMVIATGAWLVTQNLLTMGGLLACSIIANRAMLPIVQLPALMVQWAHARISLNNLDKMLALPSEDEYADVVMNPRSLQASLRFDHVRYAYSQSRRLALEIGRLEINPGERVGLIGPVGSGKSTLLKLASGLYRPNEGKIFLSNIEMTLLSPPIVRQTIGYLPQEVRLFSGTLRENLHFGLPDPGDEEILGAARSTGLIDLINYHPKGMALEITEGGRGVSGGQKTLVALTRMLLAKPKLWLLDEPTGAMDADTEARMINLFRKLWRSDQTAIIATHRTAILPLLTRLIVMHDGRIVMDGPRDEILARLADRAGNNANKS